MIDAEHIMKPLLGLLIESLFLFERVKGERPSKESV